MIKRHLGRPRHKWEDNINMNLKEIGWEMRWIHGLGYQQVSVSCEQGTEPSSSIKASEIVDKLSVY
jgi:hypothetical protein